MCVGMHEMVGINNIWTMWSARSPEMWHERTHTQWRQRGKQSQEPLLFCILLLWLFENHSSQSHVDYFDLTWYADELIKQITINRIHQHLMWKTMIRHHRGSSRLNNHWIDIRKSVFRSQYIVCFISY